MPHAASPSGAVDQPALDAPLPYGPPLKLQQAKAIMQAAEAEAERHHWPVCIVIADASGDIVHHCRR